MSHDWKIKTRTTMYRGVSQNRFKVTREKEEDPNLYNWIVIPDWSENDDVYDEDVEQSNEFCPISFRVKAASAKEAAQKVYKCWLESGEEASDNSQVLVLPMHTASRFTVDLVSLVETK